MVGLYEESLATYNKQLKQLKKLEANFAPFDAMRKLDGDSKNIKLLSGAVDKLITSAISEKEKQELNSVKLTLQTLENAVTKSYGKLHSSVKEGDNVKSEVIDGNQSHNEYTEHLNTIVKKLESMGNKAAMDPDISKVKIDLQDAAIQQPTKSEKNHKKKDNKSAVNLVQNAQHQVQSVIAESKAVITNLVGKKEPEYPKVYTDANELKTTLTALLYGNRAYIPPDAFHAATALNAEINTAVNKYLESIKTIDEAKNISVQQYQAACTSAKNTLKQECSEAINKHEDAIDIAPGAFNNMCAAINKFLKAIGSDWEITVEKTQFAGKQNFKERLVALKEEVGRTHDEIKSVNAGPKL